MADKNEVYIETALDTKALERGISQTKREIGSLEKTYQRLQEKQQKFLAMGGQKQVLSAEYKQASAEVERLGKQLENALNRKERFEENGGNQQSMTYKNMVSQIEQLSQKFDSAEKKKESLESSKMVDNPEWTKMQYDVDQVSSKIDNAKTVLRSYEDQFAQLSKGKKALFVLKKAFESLKNTAVKIGGALKKAGSAIANFGKNSNKSFKGGFKNLLRYALGVVSITALINKMRSALVEGFKNLAQFNGGLNPTNKALSNLKSSFTQLKNALATAFAPILTVVEPILTGFINKVTEAVTAIGMLIAKLTGAKTFTKAVAVQEDFAKSLSGTADSAKDANKAMDGYLSPLDEVNKISSKDSSSGGGGGVSPNDMFKEVEIESAFGNISEMLKSMWENADFTELGSTIGQKIKDGLNSINWEPIKATLGNIGKSLATLLNGILQTEGLGERIGKSLGEGINAGIEFAKNFVSNFDFSALGKFLGDGFNGLFKTIDWEGLGETLGKGLSGLFTTIKTFFDTVDWKDLGSSIVKGIKSFFANIKWGEISGTISSAVSGLFDFLSGAIQKVDWQSLPKDILNAIIDFVKGFDFKKLASSFAELLGSAIGAAAGLVVGIGKMVVDIVKKIKTAWSEKKKEWESMGLSVWEGVKLGVVNAIKNVGTWIKTNIFKPFINGFKSAFGIHSPSKEMKVMGGFLTEGLLAGLNNIPSKVQAIFLAMKTKITSVMTKIKDGFKVPINAIIGFVEKMVNGVISGINKLICAMNKLSFDVPSWVPEIGGKTFGFNISTIPSAKLPRLATGAVIPANKQFMAVLGDQKHGNNLEAPEGLIRQIVREESGNGNGTINLNVQLDGRTVYQRFIDIAKSQQTITGKNPLELA